MGLAGKVAQVESEERGDAYHFSLPAKLGKDGWFLATEKQEEGAVSGEFRKIDNAVNAEAMRQSIASMNRVEATPQMMADRDFEKVIIAHSAADAQEAEDVASGKKQRDCMADCLGKMRMTLRTCSRKCH